MDNWKPRIKLVNGKWKTVGWSTFMPMNAVRAMRLELAFNACARMNNRMRDRAKI